MSKVISIHQQLGYRFVSCKFMLTASDVRRTTLARIVYRVLVQPL